MKKLILSIVGLMTLTAVHAQQTVVVKQPGILTDAATAVIGVPAAAATGLIEGTANALSTIISGRTTVVQTAPNPFAINYRPPVPPPAPVVVAPAPVVVSPPVVVPAPTVVTPAPVVVTPVPAPQVVVPTAPAVVPSTTIVTTHGDGSVTTVTRRASAYELGPVILTPVDPTHRVGSSPHVNPYVYRYR